MVLFRYVDAHGQPDGGRRTRTGHAQHRRHLSTPRGNVIGLMPHPERAVDPLLGSVPTDWPCSSPCSSPLAPERRSLMRTHQHSSAAAVAVGRRGLLRGLQRCRYRGAQDSSRRGPRRASARA